MEERNKPAYTVDQIIPPLSELALRLEQWGEETDSSVWNIANVTNDLIDELGSVGIPSRDVYRAVAIRAKGKRPDTVRRWSECARDYPPKVQQAYAQLLSFDHFKVARRLSKITGYEPEYFLKWALESADSHFRTTNEMLAEWLPKDNSHPAIAWWGRSKERALEVFEQWNDSVDRGMLLKCHAEITRILESTDAG